MLTNSTVYGSFIAKLRSSRRRRLHHCVVVVIVSFTPCTAREYVALGKAIMSRIGQHLQQLNKLPAQKESWRRWQLRQPLKIGNSVSAVRSRIVKAHHYNPVGEEGWRLFCYHTYLCTRGWQSTDLWWSSSNDWNRLSTDAKGLASSAHIPLQIVVIPNCVTINRYQMIAYVDNSITKRTSFTPIYDQTPRRRQIIEAFDNKPKRRALHSVPNDTIVPPRFHSFCLHLHNLLPSLASCSLQQGTYFVLVLLPPSALNVCKFFCNAPPLQQVGLIKMDSQSPPQYIVPLAWLDY